MNNTNPTAQAHAYSEDAIFALVSSVREQANNLLSTMLEEQGVVDLLPAHGAVFHALYQENPLRMTVLAERIGRRKSTLTSLINTLEARGYCRREADAEDSRAQMVFLTEKGEALREIQHAISEVALAKAWQGIDAGKRRVCLEVLASVLDNLRR